MDIPLRQYQITAVPVDAELNDTHHWWAETEEEAEAIVADIKRHDTGLFSSVTYQKVSDEVARRFQHLFQNKQEADSN